MSGGLRPAWSSSVGDLRIRGGLLRCEGQGVNLAPFVERAELAGHYLDLAVVLDADLPAGRFRDPAEPAPVDDVPLVLAGRAGSLDLHVAGRVICEPVDVLGTESPGVVDVELSSQAF